MIHVLAPPAVEPPSYCWLFVRDDQRIGVDHGMGWCTQLRDEPPINFDHDDQLVLLVVLLEFDWDQFAHILVTACNAVPACASDIHRFPFERMLRHVLYSSVSDYWPDKALGWLSKDRTLFPSCQSAVQHAAANKALSQFLRHRARKLLRQHAAMPRTLPAAPTTL